MVWDSVFAFVAQQSIFFLIHCSSQRPFQVQSRMTLASEKPTRKAFPGSRFFPQQNTADTYPCLPNIPEVAGSMESSLSFPDARRKQRIDFTPFSMTSLGGNSRGQCLRFKAVNEVKLPVQTTWFSKQLERWMSFRTRLAVALEWITGIHCVYNDFVIITIITYAGTIDCLKLFTCPTQTFLACSF